MAEDRQLVLGRGAAGACRRYQRQGGQVHPRHGTGCQGLCQKDAVGSEIVFIAAEIILQAERKLGDILIATPLAHSAPGNQYTGKRLDRSQNATGPIRLKDLGLTKSDSSRERIALLNPEVFGKYISDCRNSHEVPTTAGVLRLVRARR